MRLLTRRPDHVSSPVLALTALLAAVLLFTVSSVAFPSDVLGASTLATTCDGVALRTKPSTRSTRKAILPAGVQVNAVTKVTGGSWRHTCNGKVTSGNTWYRINNVKGRSASSRYGVTYVYAVTAAFKSVPITTRYTTCDGVGLRTKPSTSATRKAVLPDDVKVASVARVSGGSWRSTCNGTTKTGNSWYRITAVNGRSVTSRYGVTYIYAATARFTTVAPGATPTPPPPPSSSVRVSSVPALLSALDNDAVTDIVVANGTYRVSTAASKRSDSLWIGARFADRTRAVTVRAETRGGVTFDGGGVTWFGGLSFEAGAHHQTWDGFNFANGQATETGVVVFGGYAGLAAPHHITLRHIKFLGSLTGRGGINDHAIYFSHAVGGPHDLLLEDITVDGTGGLSTGLHFYHSDAANKNAWNVTVRRLTVNRTQQAVMLWDSSLRNITIDTATITNSRDFAVRYEQAAAGIVLANITSTGSGQMGFYSSMGVTPPGVSFVNDSFR